MPGVPGFWLLVALNGAVLAAAVAVAAFVLRRRGAAEADTDADWRAGAQTLAHEVRRAAAPVDRPANHDRVARRLLPLAGRIHRHVRAAPDAVDEPVYRGLYELGVACQRVAIEHRSPSRLDGPFLEDRLERLRTEAETLATTVDAG